MSSSNRGCSVEGCDREHHAKGFCKKHYGQFQRRSAKTESASGASGASTATRTKAAAGPVGAGAGAGAGGGVFDRGKRLEMIRQRHRLLQAGLDELEALHEGAEV